LLKTHLNQGGVLTVFIRLYESAEEGVKSQTATFFDVFPDGAIFAGAGPYGYELILFGQVGPPGINVDSVDERLRRPDSAAMRRSLNEIGIHSSIELLGAYAGRRTDFSSWLGGAFINRDRNPKLRYLAADGLNVFVSDVIYRRMRPATIQLSGDFFTGSPGLLAQLAAFIRGLREP
jgi:hypothetical protein